jgi:hypothetical protein
MNAARDECNDSTPKNTAPIAATAARISDLHRRVVRVAIRAVNAPDFAEGSAEPQA